MKRIDWQWWARTSCVIVAIQTWFTLGPHPHTWPLWLAFDAIGIAIGIAAGGVFEAAVWTYRHYRTR